MSNNAVPNQCTMKINMSIVYDFVRYCIIQNVYIRSVGGDRNKKKSKIISSSR